MATPTEKRVCLACDKPLKGRIDKKFCDDYCRNNYNNQKKAMGNHSSLVRNINNALLKNRKVLEAVLANRETIRVNKERLLNLGFKFKFSTHSYTTKSGNVYHYCYDYGYLALENDWFLIVKKEVE